MICLIFDNNGNYDLFGHSITFIANKYQFDFIHYLSMVIVLAQDQCFYYLLCGQGLFCVHSNTQGK